MLKCMVKLYEDDGSTKAKYYADTLREALELFVMAIDDSNHRINDPTIWVLFDGNYVRVHDFNFSEVTDDTYEEYLAERILWSDYLLEEFAE